MKKVFISFSLCFTFLIQINAQVSFTASADSLVGLNETFQLNYSVNTSPSNFTPPDLSSFKVLFGPYTSISTNIYIINGITTQRISKIFTCILLAKKTGRFTIRKASIVVDSVRYYSNPITIDVVDSVKGKIYKSILHDTSFVVTILNKNPIYQGEKVLVTFKIYSTAQFVNISNSFFPNFKGFWAEEINCSPINVVRQKVNGNTYNTAIFHKKVISPYLNGNLTIEPCEMECLLQEPRPGNKKFNDFFGPVMNQEKKKIRSQSTNLKVLPLPENAPESFMGGVGKNFTFEVYVNKEKVKCNDTLSLRIRISGNANLKVLDKFKIKLDSSINISGPKLESFTNNNGMNSIDTMVYKYVITAKKVGNYSVPAMLFTYFDIRTRDYQTLSSQKINISVTPGQVSNSITPMFHDNNDHEINGFGAVIAFDVSASMIAKDFDPNRLEASKTATIEFIKHNEFTRIGMEMFAANSYLLSPLTTNFNKLTGLISEIDTGKVKDGTAIGIGLVTAINLLKDTRIKHKCIILLTDGINNTGEIDPISSAHIAQTLGIRLYTIGIGGKDSVLFPIKTLNGIVYQKLPAEIDDKILNTMSSITHGKYFRAYSKKDLVNYYKEISTIEKDNADDSNSIPNSDNVTTSGNTDMGTDQSYRHISIEIANRLLNAVEINEFMVNEKLKKEGAHEP